MSAATTHDALIENTRALNAVIGKVRQLHEAGKDAPNASRRYLESLRAVHGFSEALGAEPLAPIPFHQIVGRSPEEKRRLEYRGWFRFFERAPVQFLAAAE